MTLAPWVPEPEKVRPIFQRLRELKEACEQKLGAPLQHLSMGEPAGAPRLVLGLLGELSHIHDLSAGSPLAHLDGYMRVLEGDK